jgi:hypothetical protein
MDSADRFRADVVYRVAYGMASRLAEAKSHDMQGGRDRLHPAAGGPLAAILAEVARRLAVPPEAIREAVEDALAGRKPRR